MNKDDEQTTHFGYEQVPVERKAEKVAEVFHSVAKKYDIMNDVMSFGIHRVWKRIAIDMLALRPGHTVLDLAGGTGDLTAKISPKVGEQGAVYLTDINAGMLDVGRDRLLDQGIFRNVHITQADAEKLPFAEDFFDRIIIGFGLRNVTRKEQALKSMYDSLKPGGFCLVLEFSKPTLPGFSKIYDTYSFHLLPKFGKLITDDEDSYRYLAESIRMHPDQKTLQNMMENAGFENCSYRNLTGGVVAIHKGYKY